MKKIVTLLLFFVSVAAFGQQTLKRQEIIADTLRVKNLVAAPDSINGYATIFGKAGSLWFMDDNGNQYNLLYWLDSISNYVRYLDSTTVFLTPAQLFYGFDFLGGADRTIRLDGHVGENLIIEAAPHEASGQAGYVLISGGTSLGTGGSVYLAGGSGTNVYLGHNVTDYTGKVYTKTPLTTDSSNQVANTDWAKQLIRVIDDTTGNHAGRLVVLEGMTFGQDIWQKDADSTASAKYPANIASLKLPPDSRIIPFNLPNVDALYGDTISLGTIIGGKQVLLLYGIPDGAGGLLSYGVKIDGSLDVTGNITGANINNVYEKELTADSENNLAVTFTLESTSKVFFNGTAIPSTKWSGVGTTTLILDLYTKKYDHILIAN